MHDNFAEVVLAQEEILPNPEEVASDCKARQIPGRTPACTTKKSPQMKNGFKLLKNSRGLDGKILSSSDASSRCSWASISVVGVSPYDNRVFSPP